MFSLQFHHRHQGSLSRRRRCRRQQQLRRPKSLTPGRWICCSCWIPKRPTRRTLRADFAEGRYGEMVTESSGENSLDIVPSKRSQPCFCFSIFWKQIPNGSKRPRMVTMRLVNHVDPGLHLLQDDLSGWKSYGTSWKRPWVTDWCTMVSHPDLLPSWKPRSLEALQPSPGSVCVDLGVYVHREE